MFLFFLFPPLLPSGLNRLLQFLVHSLETMTCSGVIVKSTRTPELRLPAEHKHTESTVRTAPLVLFALAHDPAGL